MRGLDVEASDSDGHDDQRPTHHRFGPVAIDPVPILFGLKRLRNAKPISSAITPSFAIRAEKTNDNTGAPGQKNL
jgi:hypothetical protein